MGGEPDPLRYDPDSEGFERVSPLRLRLGRLADHPRRQTEERLEARPRRARRRRAEERFEKRHASLYETLRAVEHGAVGQAPGPPVDAVSPSAPAPVAEWRRRAKRILFLTPFLAGALLLVALIWKVLGLAPPSWWNSTILPAAVGGSLSIAWVGELIGRKGRKRVFSERLIGRGSVSARHITGRRPLRLIEGRPSTTHTKRPFYEFALDGGQVVLRDREAAVGGDLTWSVNVGSMQARVGQNGGNPSATARRRGLRRWVISDGGQTSTLEVTVERLSKRGLNWSHVRRLRHAVITASETFERPTGEVVLHYERTGELEWSMLFPHAWHLQGEYQGVIDMHEPISLPVAVLTLRLTLGRWAKRSPRVGRWSTLAGGA